MADEAAPVTQHATAAVPAAPAQPGAPVLAAAPAPQTVAIPLEQIQAFTAMQARLAQLEAEQHSREQAAQQEQARILAEKGDLQNALRLLREQSEQQVQAERAKLGQVEERAKRYALDGELSRALAAQNLVPGGAEQLTQLWRNRLTVQAEGDSFAVRTPAFQPVGDFVAQQLAQPEYAHFLRASSQGGTAAGQTTQAAPTPPAVPAPPPQPKNMGEAVILHMQNLQKLQGDPKVNMAMPMGLKRAAQ